MKIEWILIPVFLVGLLGLSAKVGNMAGMAEVHSEWKLEKDATAKEVSRLKEVIAGKEAAHKTLSEKNSDELARTQEEHAKALAALRTDFAERLLTSTSRATAYERLSRGTATERDRLVQHTAELDRTLEEGRSLVRELRQTLGQCEITVGVLGTQILLDRDLLK